MKMSFALSGSGKHSESKTPRISTRAHSALAIMHAP